LHTRIFLVRKYTLTQRLARSFVDLSLVFCTSCESLYFRPLGKIDSTQPLESNELAREYCPLQQTLLVQGIGDQCLAVFKMNFVCIQQRLLRAYGETTTSTDRVFPFHGQSQHPVRLPSSHDATVIGDLLLFFSAEDEALST